VLFVSILFGIALALLGEKGAKLQSGLQALTAVVFRIVHILMYAAPVGAFGAMAFTIGKYGIASLGNLAALVGTFYGTSLLFVVLVLGLIARLAGFSLLGLVRYIKDELLLVLGTSSSESAMPSLIEKLERAGCPKPVVGLVVPTGYSFNLDGTCIYMSLAALFIAQACNISLSLEQQLALMAVAIISSKGAAGVTGRGADHPGRRHGPDPRRRPLHERVPGAHQFYRQCGRHHRGRPLGARRRPGHVAGRLPRRKQRLHRGGQRQIATRAIAAANANYLQQP